MKKIYLVIILGGLILGGCGLTTKTGVENQSQNVVTRTGDIKVKVGNEYLLNTTDGIVNITSKKINLDNYIKKQITVTGMFSGTTLYVDKLEEVE